jgi:hypothetical protein
MVRSDTIEEQRFRGRQWSLRHYGQEAVGAPRRNNQLPTPPNEETTTTPPSYTVGDYNIRQNLREERQWQPQCGYTKSRKSKTRKTKRRKSLRKKHRRNQKQNFYRVLQSLYYINI